ncbi:hypothetical protein BV739P1_00035 [Phocaeicola phage BV739P1]|nr:hypothetical protein BV739P1_00035 [Phocaeicola phage BV739P1]
MIEISVKIDNVAVEGISPSTVKLTVNNADPLKFTDRTVAYSASISVPRTEVNDRIFKEMRTPWLFTKSKMYVAYLYFGGLPAPMNGGRFKAKVTAKEDGYTVELIELFTKFSSINSSFGAVEPNYEPEGSPYWVTSYNKMLQRAYPNIVIPTQQAYNNAGTKVNCQMAYWSATTDVRAGDYVNTSIFMRYRNCSDGAYQSSYPYNYLWADTSDTALAARLYGGQTFSFSVSKKNYITVDGSFTGNIRLRMVTPAGSTVVNYVLSSTNLDGTKRYSPNRDTTIGVSINGSDLQAEFVNDAGQRITPTKSLPVEDAMDLEMKLTGVTDPEASRRMVFNQGFTNGYELLMAFCKAFAWTYDYNQDTNTVTLKPFIDPGVTNAGSAKRIDWTGKIATDTVEVSELEGIGRSMIYTVGERKYRFRAFDGALGSSAEGANSSLPVKVGHGMPYAQMTYLNGVSTNVTDYFYNVNSYRKDIGDYYLYFRRGYQIKCTAYLTYFDILNFKNDGCYRIGELNEFFYIRTISNWDASTGKCTITAVALNLLGKR